MRFPFLYSDRGGYRCLIDGQIGVYWFCSPFAPVLFPFWVSLW